MRMSLARRYSWETQDDKEGYIPVMIVIICCIVLSIAVAAVVGTTGIFNNIKQSIAQSDNITLRKLWSSISGAKR